MSAGDRFDIGQGEADQGRGRFTRGLLPQAHRTPVAPIPRTGGSLFDSRGVTLRCGFCEEPRTLALALVQFAPRDPTLVALRLTLALGLHWLLAGGMQNGDVLRAGWGLPATPRKPSAMLPLSVRLRVTVPARDDRLLDPKEGADQLAGCRLDGPSGRLGTIRAVGFDPSTGEPAWLQIRTGLFVRRTVAIPFEDVESIERIRGRVTVRTGGIST